MLFKKTSYRNPWTFVPTLYFAEGVPYFIINTVSLLIYKDLNISNAEITFWTSLLYLPWVIKMFWGPFIDIYSTKRNWILYTNLAMMGCLSLIALSVQLSNFFFISLGAFTIAAFISATHDIAADGFYMLALSPERQAFYVGIRNIFYRIARMFTEGVLIVFAGRLATSLGNIPLSWSLAIGLTALMFGGLFLYHRLILPFPDSDSQLSPKEIKETVPFVKVISSYFLQNKIAATLAFILLYRFGEALLGKMATLFFKDSLAVGGLGLSTEDVGWINLTVGVISLLMGGILGGVVIAKYGLKKSIWPMALALNLPNIFYVYMAYTQPAKLLVYPLVALDQFCSGLGYTAFAVYLMYICKGAYKTSHFAISTGIMALGMMVPGLISGSIQEKLGYPGFFILVCLLAIPGMITIFFLPLDEIENSQAR
ncbi:MFS transporter [Laspinema sp. D1]|uniref:MFS transporter n=1 Tax=Laspinema palackyanum TaxID=3231601 RepID=UPI00347324D3|nr:MFS transporter [Laspinema sp. D2b]